MKKILFTMAALSLASFTFAQDFGFGDSAGGDDFGASEESSTPAVTISGEVGAETRAWIGTKEEKDGDEYNSKGYWKPYDLSKTLLEAGAYANLELNYDGDYTGANLKLKLDSSTLVDYHEDIIDELYATGNFKEGRFQLKAGKMKEVWGKGDKVHVLDNFNANNYTDFIFPDYIDRRLGEVMFKVTANLSWDYNIKLEGVYTPWMTADRFASDGYLYPAAQAKLTGIVEGLVKEGAAKDLEDALTKSDYGEIVNGLQKLTSFSANDLYKDELHSLKYSQAGLRLTGTLAGIDWGTSYYYGHYKQPSANTEYYAIYSNTAKIKAGAWETYKAEFAATMRALNPALASLDDDTVYTAGYAVIAAQIKAGAEAAGESALVTGKTDYEIIELARSGVLGTTAEATVATVFNKDQVTSAVGDQIETNGYTRANALENLSLNYDQLQVFGLEAAFVLWKFNTRWEFAYNLTEDFAGDNPWIRNNWISWVAGFDMDLPIHNLNINIQENGSFTLHKDKIEDGTIVVGQFAGKDIAVPIAEADVDYKSDGKYYNNKLIVLLSDKWLNEKLTTEVQGIWGIERKEFMVAPKVEYNVSEGLTFALRGVYLYSNNEDGEFYNFTKFSKNHDKAFVQLTAKYQF